MTYSNLPDGVSKREYDKFTLDSDGNIAVRTTAVLEAGDIEIGAVEIKDGDSDNRVTVDSNGALKVTGGASSVNAEYKSPDDFTATYTSSTTITLSGLAFTIADSSQVQYITVIPSSGDAATYVNGANGITITVSSNVLTISGVTTPFTSGDVYQVGINSQKKAYSSDNNGIMTLPLKNAWNQYTDEEPLIENGSLTSSFTQAGSDIDMRGFNVLRAGTVVVNGTSTGITLRIVQKLSDGSYIPIDGLSDTTLTSSKSYSFDLPAIETVAFQVKDAASGSGTVSLYINKGWGR